MLWYPDYTARNKRRVASRSGEKNTHHPPVDEAQPVQRRDGQGHLDHVEARVVLVQDPCNDVTLMACDDVIMAMTFTQRRQEQYQAIHAENQLLWRHDDVMKISRLKEHYAKFVSLVRAKDTTMMASLWRQQEPFLPARFRMQSGPILHEDPMWCGLKHDCHGAIWHQPSIRYCPVAYRCC
jgi:hypothetical protein